MLMMNLKATHLELIDTFLNGFLAIVKQILAYDN